MTMAVYDTRQQTAKSQNRRQDRGCMAKGRLQLPQWETAGEKAKEGWKLI